MMELLQWPGAFLGLLGAVFVSRDSRRSRRWGFALWIASNVFLIAFAVHAQAWALLAMYICYAATSIVGVRNNRNSP